MIVDIKVPTLGDSITEAVIAKWYKNVGDSINIDEIIVELETDKVTLEVPSPSAGIIKTIIAQKGAKVGIKEIIGTIDASATAKTFTAEVSTSEVSLSAIGSASSASDTKAPNKHNHSINVPSPSATKVMNDNNLDVNNISGTGKDGRITKSDAVNTISSSNTQILSNCTSNHMSSNNCDERIEMSKLRKTIAKRLKDSQNTAAILSTFNEVDMSNIINLRVKYQEIFQKQHGVKLGFMSFFVKAVVSALQAFPIVNAEVDGDFIVYKKRYDIGVAVGTNNGLVVPVLRNANIMSFAEIEKNISLLGQKAKEGKLSMGDMSGGTFSITNGGIYGSLMSTPIINPPQSAILGMHNIVQRPIAVDGEVKIRPMMYIVVSYDHRIIDGSDAVGFLVKVKNNIENPERLLLCI